MIKYELLGKYMKKPKELYANQYYKSTEYFHNNKSYLIFTIYRTEENNEFK